MKSYLKTAVYATALLLGSVSADAVLSAATAQTDVSVSFDSFHDRLAQYGDWVYSDRWGEVWVPGDVSADFHPYGFDRNRTTIETFNEQAYQLGIVGRRITAAEYFAEFLENS